ncbi:MAG: hypothetical protein ACOYXA_13965 [Bacteroidota bacterium]
MNRKKGITLFVGLLFAHFSFAQGNIGFNFTIGSPMALGRPKSYQLLMDLANEYDGYEKGDRAKFAPVSPGIALGMLVDTKDGEWKWGLNIQRTSYKTTFGKNRQMLPELTKYKVRHWYMGFDVARRIKELEVKGLHTKLYFISGLYFGSATSQFRVGNDGEWQKQWPFGTGVVYDKSGLASWNNGLLAEIELADFLFFYPRLAYQLTFSGEEGPPGLIQYVGYNGGSRFDEVNKRLNRLYLELTVGVRLGEPLKNAFAK